MEWEGIKPLTVAKGLNANPKPGNGIRDIGQIDIVSTMLNMLNHSSIDAFNLQEDDLEVYETDHYSSVATID